MIIHHGGTDGGTHIYLDAGEHVFVHHGTSVEQSICIDRKDESLTVEGPMNWNTEKHLISIRGWSQILKCQKRKDTGVIVEK